MKQTLYDKLWQSHGVSPDDDGSALLYIDRPLLMESCRLIGFQDVWDFEKKWAR